MDKHINAREKLDRLIEIVDTRIMPNIGEFIDSLTEEECKIILRKIVYGSWREFDR